MVWEVRAFGVVPGAPPAPQLIAPPVFRRVDSIAGGISSAQASYEERLLAIRGELQGLGESIVELQGLGGLQWGGLRVLVG